jgi:glutathione reductase (NADPH)
VRQQKVGQWYTYHRLKDDAAQVTTIQDRVTGQLVGAVVLAVNAEELVNDLTEVITNHKRPEEAFNWVPIYPSVASDLGYFYH